ncbi:hypothetical protein Q0812_12725 [Brevundimonas sp. 2R-24]|uniref:Uncharacterized protein n=1 Tax=Peiella sedimenti TaxID=3061083 RepID=A0ABT8SNZ2_9CAUL|nr:hypothetical protein [Caulobacteraceae bacterium XZ-24]
MRTAIATLTAAFALAGAAQAQQTDWRAAALQDLQGMHDILAANHPAVVVDQDSAQFRTWLAQGLAEAQAKADQVNSANAYAYLLSWYANGFGDGLIEAEPNWQPQPRWFGVAWPEFATEWRNGQYVVSWVKPGARRTPPVGAVLQSCDGRTADEVARRRLDGWEGDLDLDGDRVLTAPYLFWDRANPFAGGLPGNCDWRVGNSRRDRSYEWTTGFATEDERRAAYNASVFVAPQNPLGVEQWNGGYWLRMNTMSEHPDWEGFFGQVEAQREQIRNAPFVVIDLRGAEDGQANFGYRLANRLWEPEFVQANQVQNPTIVHRVTPANRQFFVETRDRVLQDPYFVSTAPFIQSIIDAYDAAAAAGQTTFTQPMPPAPEVAAPANPMQGRVIVLTDAWCSGGCLDFMDLLTRLPNVQQAGQATSASSIFIEPTRVALPTGNAWLYYGHKAWTDRPRASGQPYAPAPGLTYTGDQANEQVFRQWLQTALGAG